MSKEEIKTKSELMDLFVQLAIAKGYSDYSGDAERFINETVSVYENLPECKQPKLSIPKKVAEELEELIGKTNWESTPYSVIEEKGKINTWAYFGHGKCSEQLYKFCRDNTRLMHAYINPLTRPFVEVEG